jgi:hypothetical protein
MVTRAKNNYCIKTKYFTPYLLYEMALFRDENILQDYEWCSTFATTFTSFTLSLKLQRRHSVVEESFGGQSGCWVLDSTSSTFFSFFNLLQLLSSSSSSGTQTSTLVPAAVPLLSYKSVMV